MFIMIEMWFEDHNAWEINRENDKRDATEDE